MAGTCHSIRPHVIGSTVVKLPLSRTKPPFSVRVSGFSAKTQGFPTAKEEGPSCIFVGPIETASQETLEALYRQARDAYYSGEPLIVDDMFDRVELKLRWYGSKSVVKYPRCSIRRHSTYADAEEDLSQVLVLASIWILIFALGCTLCLVPIIYTTNLAYQDPFSSDISYGSQASNFEFLATVNGILFIGIGSVVGYSLASAAVRVLQRLWRNDLVALKGACPNCGEEVFAFVKSDKFNDSPYRAECHVCECALEFRAKVEQSVSRLGRRWVYGRVYLVS
ncbi:PGR5-like protein 1B, chloroplastic isoform X1 [Durio zibethinus]|uniref:PGR5-like protein 1B, chloroplastic isoform X1 n=1 Tax=Durio zibethinus TaxID=66656 RepID=A0A6P5XWG2_DURZI|nr:PGR5-like protein 1B, chloroplastic isoform X1 [Durio zibethinus]